MYLREEMDIFKNVNRNFNFGNLGEEMDIFRNEILNFIFDI